MIPRGSPCRFRARALLTALPAILALAAAPPAPALEAEATLDLAPTAALGRPGGTEMQTEATRILAQVAVSHEQGLAEGLSLSGTVWADADTLPSGSPLEMPEGKLRVASRVLELGLRWEALPGRLVVDLGKKVVHPSSGFFKTPLNLLSRGAASGLVPSTGAAVSAWEEGWVGVDVTFMAGKLTIANFFSPRLRWSSSADRSLGYLCAMQDRCDDLLRLGLRVGKTDLRLLAMASSGTPDAGESGLRLAFGAGADSSLGASLTVRAECSVADSTGRLEPAGEGPGSIAERSVDWAPRALAGFTWTGPDQLSATAEYYYNGLGFSGADYDRLIRYSADRLSAPGAPGPDLIDQFGGFEAGRHYGFARVSGTLETDLSPALFTIVNLQDLSGLAGANLSYSRNAWAVSGSVVDYWGAKDSEAGLSSLLWQLDLRMSLFF